MGTREKLLDVTLTSYPLHQQMPLLTPLLLCSICDVTSLPKPCRTYKDLHQPKKGGEVTGQINSLLDLTGLKQTRSPFFQDCLKKGLPGLHFRPFSSSELVVCIVLLYYLQKCSFWTIATCVNFWLLYFWEQEMDIWMRTIMFFQDVPKT